MKKKRKKTHRKTSMLSIRRTTNIRSRCIFRQRRISLNPVLLSSALSLFVFFSWSSSREKLQPGNYFSCLPLFISVNSHLVDDSVNCHEANIFSSTYLMPHPIDSTSNSSTIFFFFLICINSLKFLLKLRSGFVVPQHPRLRGRSRENSKEKKEVLIHMRIINHPLSCLAN